MGLLAIFSKKNGGDKDFSPDNIVGKRGIVSETVNNLAGCGQVKVFGQCWAARSAYDDEIFEIGDTVSIVAVEGVRLVCVKN